MQLTNRKPVLLGLCAALTLFASPAAGQADSSGVSYAARKTLVLDGGFNRGLTGTSTRWEAFVGLLIFCRTVSSECARVSNREIRRSRQQKAGHLRPAGVI
jgi:hypothetical protein